MVELTRDEATETNKLNVLLDLTNRVIEVEKAVKAKNEENHLTKKRINLLKKITPSQKP